MRLKVWILVIECFFGVKLLAQSDSLFVKVKDTLPQTVQVKKTWNTDPLSPARAAFYSAILPGLGQAYNKSYWKIPIVYLAIGIPTYLYVVNDKELDRYRTDGNPRLSTDALRRAQDTYRRNKEMAMLFAIGFYALNIIEANVDAHLKQFNVNENLSLEPYLYQNRYSNTYVGLTCTYKF